MNVFLMYRDRDFDPEDRFPWNAEDLKDDLGLNILFDAMAAGDNFVRTTAECALLGGTSDVETIEYRQAVMKDCLAHPEVVQRLYDLSCEAIEKKRHSFMFGIFSRYPRAILSGSVNAVKMFIEYLIELRTIAEEQERLFESEGFSRLFAMLQHEFDDEYVEQMRDLLNDLQFRKGVVISAGLGRENGCENFVLQSSPRRSQWLSRIFSKRSRSYSFQIAPRDDTGARILGEIHNHVVNAVANALAQSADHILAFFTMLRREIAFYIAALNLHRRLQSLGMPSCFPESLTPDSRIFDVGNLYDPALALTLNGSVYGSTVSIADRGLFFITGANQGGKSTFLRSVGVSQLMMQCGMFVAANRFRANTVHSMATHFRREEDASMRSGKFDEELVRMSVIVDHLGQDSLLLCNESFAATNELEGTEIARGIVSALRESGVEIFFVTHFYELARYFDEHESNTSVFLRAERMPDGTRTFRMQLAKPQATSYGQDLYRRVFGEDSSPGDTSIDAPARETAPGGAISPLG